MPENILPSSSRIIAHSARDSSDSPCGAERISAHDDVIEFDCFHAPPDFFFIVSLIETFYPKE
jgi:hypothetical protein